MGERSEKAQRRGKDGLLKRMAEQDQRDGRSRSSADRERYADKIVQRVENERRDRK